MSTIREKDKHMERWLAEDFPPDLHLTSLPDEVAEEVVQFLKQEADRYWSIDPNTSLKYADRIVGIGRARNDNAQEALGLMARGDGLKFLGRLEEAWAVLEQAGNMFLAVNDEVGWARTQIGRIYLAGKLNSVANAFADVERARAIFIRHGEYEKVLRLNLNLATVHFSLGEEHKALDLYQSSLAIAETLGEAGEQYLGLLYMNIGVAYAELGEFSQALASYERARVIYTARNETRNIVINEYNIAFIAQAQGHHRVALQLLYGILERGIEQFPFEYRAVKRDMTECYLHLNRYLEARDLARQVIADYRDFGAAHELGRSLLHLATAEAELGDFDAAQAALDEARSIFDSLGATPWVATTYLKRGQIKLKQGDAKSAYQEAIAAANCFEASGQQVNYATAMLLQGQALFTLNDLKAAEAGAGTLQFAQRYNVPLLRYAAHLLLGRIAESRDKTGRAIRSYQAAVATIERVQRGLTITLQPGFLQDKGEASRALISLYLRDDKAGNAFEAVERAKSQVLLGYLANRAGLRWATDDARSQTLLDELNRLRAEHQWYYRLAHDQPAGSDRPAAVSPGQAVAEVTVRERRMRAITEQLYIQSGHQANRAPALSLPDVQHTLRAGELLIEFYNDRSQLWAFVLDGQTIDIYPLPVAIGTINQLMAQLQANLAAALRLEPQAKGSRGLTQLARKILQRLHGFLLEPLRLHRYGRQRLIIVPYGSLHYLPFHLLHDGSTHLIEKYEVVILPAAGLATQPGPQRKPGALILTHSFEGRLPHTLVEGQMVQRLFGGTLRVEEEADRTALQTQPGQILHIAAHGEHRLDHPDLSYLQLADGQLYADDMLQGDMSYELVTLSACETGRSSVAASDELIGLGRGFLYAGAGALLVSLWQVADTSTLHFMERMYETLRAGASKAAALREAQQFMLAKDTQLHPAFWGAFQLIGDARPLYSAMI
jgi:CHAT domain-containing protein/tetratricopeptide (TPR) repeat protein